MVLASQKQKEEVENWFSNLRNEICMSFENIEMLIPFKTLSFVTV